MPKKIIARFYLVTLIGWLALAGSACGRSTMSSLPDPVQASEPDVENVDDGTIGPHSENTVDEDAATGPIAMDGADTPEGSSDDSTATGMEDSNETDSPAPDAPAPTEGSEGTSGGTTAGSDRPWGRDETPGEGPTYGDGGGGVPYDPGQEGPSGFRGLPSGEILRRVTATRTPGSVNVFFRNSQGHLCRVMGPPELVWGSANRPQTACFDAYTIDRPPQVVYDPGRRKIYAFAPDQTGDLGQAHGFRFYVCEADSIRCTASTHLLWESRFHFYPALVFIKGATPAQDRIVGFSHAGDGGRLAYFTVDPNPESLRHGWNYVGSKLIPGPSVSACGEWAAIDRSPVAFFSDAAGNEALHVMGRTGDGDLLHLRMSSSHLNAFKVGESGFKFSCQKISETFEGRDGLGNMGVRRRPFSLSPNAVWRGDGSVDVFGAVKAGDFSGWSMRLWSVGGDGAVKQASWLEDLTTPSAYGASMQMSLQLASEERLTLVRESSGPESAVHLFANVSQSVPAPGTDSEVTVHGTVGPAGTTKTLEILPFRFGGQTSAVTDDKGNLHLFGASYEAGSNGHFRLIHAARPAGGGFPWVKLSIAAGQSIQKGGRGAGESGVTAIWVPGTSPYLNLSHF